MSEPGVFAVSRGIWDHPVLGGEPFSRREAWIWLVSSAAWKERRISVAGRTVILARGEFCFSIRFLAVKWKWHRARVERVISVFKNEDMLRDTSRDKAKVYLISNYNGYQVVGLPSETRRETPTETAPRQHRDKEETFKHLSTPFSKEKGRQAVTPNDPWKVVYDRGKEVLGKNAGGQISQLKKLHGKPHKVMNVIEDAAGQREPAAWVARILWNAKDDGKLSGEYIGQIGPLP